MNVSVSNGRVKIKGTIGKGFNNAELYAANPIDMMSNYSGSGLPFPCESIAFENTPNRVKIVSTSYEADFIYPNSYYLNDGRTLVNPTIFLKVDGDIVEKYELENPLPLRTLNYRRDFYDNRDKFFAYKYGIMPVETQFERMKRYKQIKLSEGVI